MTRITVNRQIASRYLADAGPRICQALLEAGEIAEARTAADDIHRVADWVTEHGSDVFTIVFEEPSP